MQLPDLPVFLPPLEHAIDQHFPTLPATAAVTEALALMSQIRGVCGLQQIHQALDASSPEEARASCVLVVEAGKLVGIFTERNAVRLTASGINLSQVAIAEVMTQEVVTLSLAPHHSQSIFTALSLFRQHQIRHLPVLDAQGQLVGVITPESIRQVLQPTNLLRLRQVSEVMATEVISAPLTSSVLQLAQLMATHHVSCIVIVDGGTETSDRRHPIGIITERDIVQFQSLALDLSRLSAQAVMSTPLFLLRPGDSLWMANRKMQQRRVRRLVVASKEGELIGIITQSHLLQVLDPREMYGVVELLQQSVCRLEAEKVKLLQDRNNELEQQVQARTTELQMQVKRERLLGTIAARIRASLNLEDILQTAVSEGQQLLQADRVLIYRFWADGSGSAVTEASAPGWDQIIGHSYSAEVFPQDYHQLYQQGRICAIEDVEQADIAPCLVEFLAQMQVKAKLVVPLLYQDRLWGLLVAHQCYGPRQWQSLEINWFQELATQLAIAIQQAELYHQLQSELTERRQNETEITAWKNRYEAAIQASGQILYDWNAETNEVTYGGSYEKILGYSLAEIAGSLERTIALIHPEDQTAFVQEINRVLATEEPFHLEYRLRKKDGTYIFVQDDGNFFSDTAAHQTRMVGFIIDISERRQAEIKLKERENRLHAIIENEPECVKVIAADGTLLEMNAAGLKMIGAESAEAVIGQSVYPLIAPEYLAAFQALNQHVCQGEKQKLEFEIIGFQEQRRWLATHAVPLVNPVDQTLMQLAITRDITEQKQTTQKLQQSMMLQRAILDSANYTIIATAVEGTILTFNAAAERLLGYSAAEIVGKTTPIIFHDLNEIEQRAEELAIELKTPITPGFEVFTTKICRGEPDEREWSYIRKDGSRFPVLLSLTVLRDSQNQITGYLHIGSDITERKQAETERDRFFTLSLDMLCIAGFDGYFKRLNPAWERTLGYTYNALLAQPFIDLVHPEDVEATLAEVSKLATGKETIEFENRYRCQDGSYKWLLWNAIPFLSDPRESSLIYSVAHDITQRKQAEAEIKQLNETLEQRVLERTAQLEAANKELDSFSYSVSHDLRAPLRHINGFVSALSQELTAQGMLNQPKTAHYLQVIQDSSLKMGQLIDGLLTLSRLGRRQFQRHPVPLRQLVDRAITLATGSHPPFTDLPKLEFRIEELPTVKGDATLLQQVFSNLIDNAIKFSRDRHPACIEIGTLADGTIFIRDNGVGFPSEHADQLFGAFQRLHSPKAFPGTGIGLAIVQRIIHRHDGEIWAESNPGKGACFYFKL